MTWSAPQLVPPPQFNLPPPTPQPTWTPSLPAPVPPAPIPSQATWTPPLPATPLAPVLPTCAEVAQHPAALATVAMQPNAGQGAQSASLPAGVVLDETLRGEMAKALLESHPEGLFLPDQDLKLFVGCVPRTADEDFVRKAFSMFGPIKEVGIIKKGGLSSGAAFVRFSDVYSSLKAIAALDGRHHLVGSNQPLHVSFAKRKPQLGTPVSSSFSSALSVTMPAVPTSAPMQPANLNLPAVAVHPGTPSVPDESAKWRTLYIGNLPPEMTEPEVRAILSYCGQVEKWSPSTGFGFCTFQFVDGTFKAMKLLTDFEVDGKKLMVKVGKKEQDQIEQAMLAKSQTGALPEFDLDIERLKIKLHLRTVQLNPPPPEETTALSAIEQKQLSAPEKESTAEPLQQSPKNMPCSKCKAPTDIFPSSRSESLWCSKCGMVIGKEGERACCRTCHIYFCKSCIDKVSLVI